MTAGYDNRLILWDRATRRPVARAWHDHLVNSCSFSPDGRHVVSSSSDHTARVWSLPDLRLVAVLGGHGDDVETAAFSPDGRRVATASRDHHARIFDLDGRLLTVVAGHEADVLSVVWDPSGERLITSSDDGTIRTWSADDGRALGVVDMAGVETDTIAVSHDGTIYAGDDDGRLTTIDGTDRSSVAAHDAGVKRLVLDDVEPLLVSLSYDRTMRLWDVSGARPTLRVTADLPADVWPRSCAFVDSTTLVFATFGDSYRTYDVSAGAWLDEHVGPTSGVNAVVDTGDRVLCVGDEGRVSDAEDGSTVATTGSLANFLTPLGTLVLTGGQLGLVADALTGRPLHQHRSPLNCGVRFERGGVEHALVGTYTGEGLVFRVGHDREPALEFVAEIRLHDNAVKSVALSGNLIFSVAADAGATWLDTETLEVIRTVPDGHDKIANGCAGLGTEGRFVSVSRDLALREWEIGRCVRRTPTPHDHSVKCVAASSDGRLVATASYNGHAAVYDRVLDRWTVSTRLSMTGVSSLTYSERRGEFLAGCYDGTVHRLPVQDGAASDRTSVLAGALGVVR
nr:WD40 repeat domain-containing protein [Actinomycetospora corticicola]